MPVTAEFDPSKPLKNRTHEAFATRVAKGLKQSDAYRELFKCRGKSAASVHVRACELARKVAVRIDFLQKQSTDSAIMDIAERKRTLSEIARARLHHFGTAGADGFVLSVGPENLNSAGVEAIKTRTEITGQGGKDQDTAIVSEIKLRCPMKAIDILNKMDGVYVEKHEHSGQIILIEDEHTKKVL